MNPRINEMLLSIPVFLLAITIHEYAHGRVALRKGDSTALEAGRLSLSPLAHIDPVGTIIFPLLLILSGLPAFGWAKPVPINFNRLDNPKKDLLWVGLAGPASNIIFAMGIAMILRFLPGLADGVPGQLIFRIVIINLLLGIFNLIPIPPLDGSRILTSLLPLRQAIVYMQIERYGFLILLVLLWTGIIGRIIFPIVSLLAYILLGSIL
jgi:Zn-dependent protease